MFRLAFPFFATATALALALPFAPAALAQSAAGTPLSVVEDDALIGGTPADPVAAAEEVDLPEPAAAAGEEDDFYKIRVGDTLTISVLEDPNLTRTVFVRPDGRVSLPIAGSVKVEGVSPEDLEVILQERFSRGFQITPTVTVSIRGIGPGRPQAPGEAGPAPITFFMLGSIGRRGPIAVPEPVTILEALAIAGGPSDFAASDRIQIRRFDEEGVEQILYFDYSKVEDGELIENNIVIEERDIIFVPERGLFD